MPALKPKPDATLEPLSARARGLQAVSTQLAEMINDLKAERGRLEARHQAAGVQAPLLGEAEPVAVRAELADLRDEESRLHARLDEIEALRRSASDELVGLQEQIAHTVGLHVALRRLHEAEDRGAVVDAIQDIVVNIVGSEQLAVLAARPGGGLEVAASMGENGRLGDLDARVLALALEQGEILSGERAAAAVPGALACVPLRAHGRAVGLLLVFGLLPQKAELGPEDLEVFQLLQVHGALALRATTPEGAAHVVT